MSNISVGSRALERVRRAATKNGYYREGAHNVALMDAKFGFETKKAKGREPEPIGNILTGFYSNKAFAKKLLLPQIADIWPQIVGAVVAEHTTPKAIVDDVLYVNANSSVWAAQLSALGQILVNKINVITGSGEIGRIQVQGPKANVPNYGPRTAKGRIGYRDTFG